VDVTSAEGPRTGLGWLLCSLALLLAHGAATLLKHRSSTSFHYSFVIHSLLRTHACIPYHSFCTSLLLSTILTGP
jgi:hypothetical protein